MLDEDMRTNATKDQSSLSAGSFCVLVSSSDRARDVFEIVFQNAETIWRDCDWPRYVGFTNKHPDMFGFRALAAKKPSDWRGELGDQLDSLPDHIKYVLLLVEDTLFTAPVDGSDLNAIANLMVRDDLAYVRLVPVTRNTIGRLCEYFRHKFDRRPLRLISCSEPYYSSVEFAVWKRSYLRSMLRQAGSIWEFEHIVTNERHYAVWKPIVEQDQIVTRGKWSFRARRKLAGQGLSLANSKREFQSFESWLRRMREKLSFQIGGFLSFRIRRRLNKISRT
jgi:hypothetical protein